MENSQFRHAILPPLSRDDEHRLAVEFLEDRRAFATLVLNLPFALKEVVFDDEFAPPSAGQRWPMPQLEACYARILQLASDVDDSDTKRIASEARQLKERIDQARTQLILSNLAFVVSQVGQIRWRTVPFADLVQEGTLGLLEAVDRFEPERGHRLSTYAVWWIRRSLSAALRDAKRLIRIPEHTQLRMQALQRVRSEFHEALGREPTRRELAAGLDLPLETVAELSTLSREPIPLENFGASNDMPGYLQVLADPDAPDPLRKAMDRNLCERIHAALGMLASREARVVRLRFGIGGRRRRTLKEIGRLLNVSRERVRQIECIALAKLQTHLEAIGLTG
jgi:RNA polymerase primary sigma factor